MPKRSVWAAGAPGRGLLWPAQEGEISPFLAKGEFRVELTGFTDGSVPGRSAQRHEWARHEKGNLGRLPPAGCK
jgi:hypothetical protein